MNKKYNKEQIEELNHPDYMFKCVCCGISKPNLENGETWQTLEDISVSDDPENYDDISGALLSGLIKQL